MTMSSASDDSHVDDPALDFLSVLFDPLKALQTSPSKVELPHPTVQPCDNLQAYTSVVCGTRQDPRPPTSPPGAADNADICKHIIKAKHIKTVFDFMERTEAGPFTLLQTCRSKGRRVRVTLRHCVGVRGVCEGVVLVYDRHLNIVLAGVTEWCTPFRTVSNGGIMYTKRKKKLLKQTLQLSKGPLTPPQSSEDPHAPPQSSEDPHTPPQSSEGPHATPQSSGDPLAPPQSTFAPLCKEEKCKEKWEMCRTIKQLFIRGDNIIHITML